MFHLWTQTVCAGMDNKLRRITQPDVAICQKLADSEIIPISTCDKSIVIISLE